MTRTHSVPHDYVAANRSSPFQLNLWMRVSFMFIDGNIVRMILQVTNVTRRYSLTYKKKKCRDLSYLVNNEMTSEHGSRKPRVKLSFDTEHSNRANSILSTERTRDGSRSNKEPRNQSRVTPGPWRVMPESRHVHWWTNRHASRSRVHLLLCSTTMWRKCGKWFECNNRNTKFSSKD